MKDRKFLTIVPLIFLILGIGCIDNKIKPGTDLSISEKYIQDRPYLVKLV